MSCGIKITCRKRFGQWMITGKPFALVDDGEKIEMRWKKETFIPLQSNISHKISVQFPYLTRTTGKVLFDVQVKLDETQV